MKKIYKFLLMAIVATSPIFYSCETTDLDKLVSPNDLSPDQADADLLLNSIQLDYWSSITSFNNRGAELSRIDYMFGRNYFNNYGPGSLNNPWGNLYSGMIPDIANIESLSTPEKPLAFHIGVSKIMEAHILMLMVDYLGDIVWSEANNPTEFPSPKVDDGEAVYTAALALLEEAKTLLDGASAGAATDLFYDGDASKWIKLANTLKMRADLTVGNYQAVVNATNVIATTDDDFEFKFGTNELQPDNRSGRYITDYRTDGAGNYQSNWLMDIMSGDAADWLGLTGNYTELPSLPNTDPRRRYYFYRQSFDTPGNFSMYYYTNSSGAIRVRDWPEFFDDDNTNGETLQCSLQAVPNHFEFTPDENTWCSVKLGYWGRSHGNDEGTPPDSFKRTAIGLYPAGGSFDNQADLPYVGTVATLDDIYNGLANIPHGSVGLGNGAGGAGIEPIMLASYVDFMKAEASLHLGNVGDAATYLESGMTKSIAKVMSFGDKDPDTNSDFVPTASEVTTYINSVKNKFVATAPQTSVDGFGFPVTKDKMDILGEQYFIAMFGGAGDAFNFIRRTGYPRTLQRSVESNPGLFPRTFLYPSDEKIANPNIIQRTDLSTKVFWDSGVTNPAN